jgi:putative heme-binding domain-containing protein
MNRSCGLAAALVGIALFAITARPLASPRKADSRDEYARYALRARGDAGKGRAIFADARRTGCIRCHRVGGEGGAVGPDLSDVGAKFARDHLIESVLEPSRQIVEGYRSTLIASATGRVMTGLVKSETAAGLILVDGELREQVVDKTDIVERKFIDQSIMPDGLAAGLSREQLTDVIAYLETLRSAGQPTPGSGIVGPLHLSPGFRSEKLVGGITAATALAAAPDRRIFVCEQTGTLRVVKDAKLLPEPFLVLQVDSQWERGLIGVALDPNFQTTGWIYVNYVASEPYPHHRVSRFTARGDVAAKDSEVVLLRGDDQRKLGGSVPAGHQAGALHFGKCGKLFIAIGDQTAGWPAQRFDTFQGKLLRIDPDGGIPHDNPYYTTARGKYRAIWALGLRNPFTFAVQPRSGRIFINDVGESTWEEVNEGVAGANYGWPEAEGPASNPRFCSPIHTYPVASVAGGAFCPERPGAGTMFPQKYRGRYFFMDFVKGWIKVLDPDHPSEAMAFATGLPRPVDLAFAPDGSLLVLLRDAWVIDDKFTPHTGSVLRISFAPKVHGKINDHSE